MSLHPVPDAPRSRPRQPVPSAARAAAGLALAACLVAPAARGATITVQVSAADGSPAAGIAVQVSPARAGAPVPPRAASEPVVIAQKDVRFVPALTVVPVGSTVRFTNQDRFDHHIRSLPGGPLGTLPPATEFEYRLPGAKERITSVDLRLDTPGVIVLGCHLHSTMRGQILVTRTPYVGVTDATGLARIDDLPEGEATVTLWHPEQLADQPPVHVRVSATPALLPVTLNFTPPRRRGGR